MERFIDKYYAVIFGCTMFVASLLLAFTFVVPVLTIMPLALLFESMAPSGSQGLYSIIGNGSLFILSLCFVIYYGINYKITKMQMRFVFFLEWFVVHTVGYDVCWWFSNGFHSDGQLIFLAMASFFKSGFVFILLGVLLMFLRRKNERNH